jgi:hypothetical protein
LRQSTFLDSSVPFVEGFLAIEGRMMRRFTLLVAAFTIPITGLFALGLAGPAAASGSSQSCSVASGSATGNLTPTKCSVGLGKGTAKATSLATGGTITFSHKVKVTFKGSPTTDGQGPCSKGSTEYVFTGTVTHSTTKKIRAGTKVSGKACLSSTSAISLVKNTKFVF